jgi:hypothetical protein
MRPDELLRSKREAILELAAKHGAQKVRVFGSAARGESSPDSDIDFLVDMEDGRNLLDLVALWQDLEELLGCKVEVITDGGTSPYLRERIYAEAVPLRKTRVSISCIFATPSSGGETAFFLIRRHGLL